MTTPARPARNLNLRPRGGPGQLIALEGFDGSGKSTLARQLVAALRAQGWSVITAKTPTAQFKDTRWFQDLALGLRADLVSPLALQVAHMADRLQLLSHILLPGLDEGSVVIVDRYLSGAAGALDRWQLSRTTWFDDLAREFPAPDVWVYLHTGFDTWTARMGARPPGERTQCTEQEYLAHRFAGLRLADANAMTTIDTGLADVQQCCRLILDQLQAATAIPTRQPSAAE